MISLVKDLGEMKYYLGLEVTRSKEGIFISQRKFVSDLLKFVDMINAKLLTIPLDQHTKLYDNALSGELIISDPSLYRILVGKV